MSDIKGQRSLFFSSIKNRILVFVVIFELTAYGTIQLFNNYIYKAELLILKDSEVSQMVAVGAEKIKNISQLMERNVTDLAQFGEQLYSAKHNYLLSMEQVSKQAEQLLLTNFRGFEQAIGGGIWFEPYALDKALKYFGPYVFRDKDKVVFSWDLNTPEYDYPNQQWYSIANVGHWQNQSFKKRPVFWTEPYYDEAGSFSLMMTVDAVMFDHQGNGIGMATVDWSLQELTQTLDKIKVSKNAYPFFIYQGDGMFLSYPKDKSLVLKSAARFDWGKQVLLNRETGKMLALHDVMIDGEAYYIYYYRTEQGFIFGSMLPLSDQLQSISTITTITLMAGLTIGLAFIILMVILMRLLFTPFDKVLALIKASIVRSKDSKKMVTIEPIDYPEHNEFTPIVDALGDIYRQITAYVEQINRSKLEIEQFNTELEGKVVDRTRQLEYKSNEAVVALEKLQKTQLQLIENEKHAAMGRLVAGVAHEINTPLGVAVTAASCISRELVATMDNVLKGRMKRSQVQHSYDEMQKGLRILNDNLGRASDLINSFKQIAVDQSSEEYRQIKIGSYINKVLRSLRPQIAMGEHEVIFNCDEQLQINSQPGAIAQILTNLVENTLIHAFADHKGGTIDINVSKVKNGVELRYSDDGKGMSRAVQESIFEPFFTTNRKGGGSGLGMHLVYNLIQQKLEGSISVHSVEGKGTIFIIILPDK